MTTHFARSALPVSSMERDEVLRALEETRVRRSPLLFAYVVMPTHVHLLFAPRDGDSLSAIMREFKVRSAKRILSARGRQGTLWQARFFDRIMRNRQEWSETIDYIHGNPVKDGLVARAEDWPWSSWAAWQPGGVGPVPVDIIDMPINPRASLAW